MPVEKTRRLAFFISVIQAGQALMFGCQEILVHCFRSSSDQGWASMFFWCSSEVFP